MATINRRPNKHKWIQFTYKKKRRTLRLGKTTESQALDAKRNVESLLLCLELDQPITKSIAGWILGLTGVIRKRLQKIGLIESDNEMPLETLCKYVEAEYENGNKKTYENIQRAITKLKDYFGSRSIASFTIGDADEFRRHLEAVPYKPSYVSTLMKRSARIFNISIRKGWLEKNPFEGQKGLIDTDTSRQEFVSQELIQRVVDNLHDDPMWQAIVMLIRFGGVRAPMEALYLKWQHFDFKAEFPYFKVFCSKTKVQRTTPIFPEMTPYLLKWKLKSGSSEHVITKHRNSDKALYSALKKRLSRMKIKPWEKLFINLRSSRETELVEEFPIHVVTAWLGNSPAVAKKHYLQVRDDHFRRACRPKGDAKGDVS